ncbi:hypothetical protein EV192_106217 [Actinocrispum wychmicini]|uniref:Uncharacterized protein n=1 Tax=Actinocrispum wychmicini TaxID=1213861 RepID=A0A4R2JEV0_9PSEU|nr:hypothetical protein EV192_106217 [Actinocrispum wychmicini]
MRKGPDTLRSWVRLRSVAADTRLLSNGAANMASTRHNLKENDAWR